MAAYQYLVYFGLFGLLLHPIRVAAIVVIALSFLGGLDALLGTGLMPHTRMTNPWIFLSSYTQCVALAVLGLLVAIPKGERSRFAGVVPLYFFYAAFLIAPASLGFLNWFTVRLFGRRLIGDPYQDEASLLDEIQRSVPEVRHA
jgi:hypothetical protein